jgi:hypothetical protein
MRTTQPGQSFLLLLDVVAVLKKQNIDYAVIGAMAASFHGVVRASLDADAVLSLTAPALASLEVPFKKAGFQTELRRGDYDDPIGALLALSDSHRNRVDLLIGIRGMDPEVFSRAVEMSFERTRLRIIGLEDFIAMKLFAGGPRDIDDARRAIAVSEKSLDHKLVEKLTARFGSRPFQILKKLFIER